MKFGKKVFNYFYLGRVEIIFEREKEKINVFLFYIYIYIYMYIYI